MPTYKEKKQRLRELVKKQEEERINAIRAQGHPFNPVDAFRVREKQYKYYVHRPTDFNTLLDPNTLKRCHLEGMEYLRIYQIDQPQGAYLVKGFIKQDAQFQVGFEALNDYIRRPYRTNLDGTNGLYLQKEAEAKEEVTKSKEEQLEKNQEAKEQVDNDEKQGQGITIEHYAKQEAGIKKEAEMKKEEAIQNEQSDINKGYFFNDRIRMANLGYQYDWPHRCYPKTQVPIPQTIAKLTKQAQQLFQKLSNNQNLQYHGEAVIVNYYKPREYMIGHLDDGEEDQTNPIFSFNFGLSCVFLLGFPDKNTPPVALRLEAGDLLIMSGFSRICYHGVPRIIEDSYKQPEPSQQIQQIADKIEKQVQAPLRINGFKEIIAYYKAHRLNLNVRQVWARKSSSQQQQQIKAESI